MKPGEPTNGDSGALSPEVRDGRLRCDRRGRPAGEKLGAAPTNRSAVNVGTVLVSALSALAAGSGAASADGTGRGGAFVVVRAGESPVHGEGRQRALRLCLEGEEDRR